MGAIIISMMFVSCATAQRQAAKVQVDAHTVAMTYPTELRGAYYFSQPGQGRFCAEPAPDIALESLKKITADLTAKLKSEQDIGAKATAELSDKVVQLAGRTELLLLARELLYRACEMGANNPNMDPKQLAEMYQGVVKLVTDLGLAERTQAEAKKAEAESEKLRAEKDLIREKNALKAGGQAFDDP